MAAGRTPAQRRVDQNAASRDSEIERTHEFAALEDGVPEAVGLRPDFADGQIPPYPDAQIVRVHLVNPTTTKIRFLEEDKDPLTKASRTYRFPEGISHFQIYADGAKIPKDRVYARVVIDTDPGGDD